jgi:acyl transferase domain-containing protein
MLALHPAGMLSPEGRCKTLDASADGYVRAEAVGGLMLEHLSSSGSSVTAQVLAVLAGSAVNQDGRSSNLTAPNGPAQQKVLRAALTDAGLEPTELSGLSMHGTGTPLGKWLLAIALSHCTVLCMRSTARSETPSGASSNWQDVTPALWRR